MKKIPFNDSLRLTKAVLEGCKTQTRRIIQCPKTYKGTYVSGFRVCRRADGTLFDTWLVDEHEREIDGSFLKPTYRVGEEVAIAQSYKDAGYTHELYQETLLRKPTIIKSLDSEPLQGLVDVPFDELKGWNNKLYVRADLMQHIIKITNVRVERLQDISDEDCLKEGIEFARGGYYTNYNKETNSRIWLGNTPKEAFSALINKTCGRGTWESNPYVFVYDFELVK